MNGLYKQVMRAMIFMFIAPLLFYSLIGTVTAEDVSQEGKASWYSTRSAGRVTANEERLNNYALTAAHRDWPFNTRVRVINLQNNKEIEVRINDRGPFKDTEERVIDLTRGAFRRLASRKSGLIEVRIEVIEWGDESQTEGEE